MTRLRAPGPAKLLIAVKRKCRVCKSEFVASESFRQWCSFDCGAILGQRRLARRKAVLEKADRAAVRERKEKLKTRSDYIKEAQVAFNAWVKERDIDLPCVSCGRHHQGAYHAGHYLSTGARPELRFEPMNVWKQCAPCNTHLSGNLVLYRQELVRRIGSKSVEWLEGPHEPVKLTGEDLRQMAKDYRAMTRALKGKRC